MCGDGKSEVSPDFSFPKRKRAGTALTLFGSLGFGHVAALRLGISPIFDFTK